MLSRKDSTQKYISIKEQKQKKYDNNITIIIYTEIKLHSESNSSNLTCGKLSTHNMNTWHARMAFIGYMSSYISPKGFYLYIIFSIIENRNKE